jgi:hypothetical protein
MAKHLYVADAGKRRGRPNPFFFEHGKIVRANDFLCELEWLEPRRSLRAILCACKSTVFPDVGGTPTYTYSPGPEHVTRVDVGQGFASVAYGRRLVALRSGQPLTCPPHFGQRVRLFTLLIRVRLLLFALLSRLRRNLVLSALSARLLRNSVVLCQSYIFEYFRQERELFLSLIHLLLRFLASPRQLRNVTLIGHDFFEQHGFGRPPRAMGWALAGGLPQAL